MKNYLNCKKEWNIEQLKKPAQMMKNGSIVIFPTETVYGIGTNGLDASAAHKLYTIKQRASNKPISLLVSDMEMIRKVTKNITEEEYKIMKAFFPGPLTIILKKSAIVPDIVTAGKDTVGIRMPEGKIARELIRLAGVPIAAPSANISDKPCGINVESIYQDFYGKVDFWIDGGKSKLGMASTIVQVVNGKPIIIREGCITKQEIMDILKK